MLDNVKHIILVLSGKGGVGKSTVSTQLALTLKEAGFKVRYASNKTKIPAFICYKFLQIGLLDIDLCGPSIPYLMNLENKDIHQCDDGWVPVYHDTEKRLAVMSIGFLLKSRNDPIIWRGPKKTGMIKQFLTDVNWEDIDYLIIDTPPGTSDEHITVMECMREVHCDGAIIVTTPQEVAIEDVRKEVTFCKKTGINILGIVENMSSFVCPNCLECSNIFSSGGGAALAELAQVPFLGTLPIDPCVGELAGTGKACIVELPECATAKALKSIVEKLVQS